MNCIELIKEDISIVRKESQNTKYLFEKSVNDYLDKALEFKCSVGFPELQKRMDALVESIFDHFNEIGRSEYMEIKPSLEELKEVGMQLYTQSRESGFYPAIISSVEEFHYSIDYLQEVMDDLEMAKVTIPDKSKFKEYSYSVR